MKGLSGWFLNCVPLPGKTEASMNRIPPLIYCELWRRSLPFTPQLTLELWFALRVAHEYDDDAKKEQPQHKAKERDRKLGAPAL